MRTGRNMDVGRSVQPPVPGLSARSPERAAVLSALFPGGGQLYNRQLERALQIWIMYGAHAALGVLLLAAALSASVLPPESLRPPLGDWIADHRGGVLAAWLLAGFGLWWAGIRDAKRTAEQIN